MENNKKLSVEAIEDGTVIDHIPAGKALFILRQFKLLHHHTAVTVGFNLPSSREKNKDIIKIANVHFDENDANRLSLFIPHATVNDIKNFDVVKKRALELPDHIFGILNCLNSNCASHKEPIISKIYIKKKGNEIKLKCHYCEKIFSQDSFIEA